LTQEPVDTPAVAFVTPDLVVKQLVVNAPTSVPPGDVKLENMTGDSWFSISPNGGWTAQVRVAYPIDNAGNSTGDQYYNRLEVLKQDGSQRWIVIDEWSTWGLGYSVPDNLHWRADSARLYYSLRAVADAVRFLSRAGPLRGDLEAGLCATWRARPMAS
jgi:hypothetical protein